MDASPLASLLLLFISLAIACCPTAIAAPADAQVLSLPGFNGDLPSKHYSGFITVDEEHGRKLFYYFVESQNNPTTDPVVLWTNGGPGCSSFDGFVYEHGPFNFEDSQEGILPKLTINPFSWTKIANIIYLEQPAGVGFSFSNTTADYVTGDTNAAKDVHAFLLEWFEEYAEYVRNPFYVAGESYAGIYVPTICQEIVNGIEKGVTPTINLKGYLIGNGVTDEEYDGNALVPFVNGMGLIPNELYEEVHMICNGTYWKPPNSECSSKLDEIYEDIKPLNIYNILEPCYHNTSIQETIVNTRRLPESFIRLGESEGTRPIRKRMFGRSWPLFSIVKPGWRVPSWRELGHTVPELAQSVSCLDDHLAGQWLNNATVRKAIHAPPEDVIGRWEICSDKLSYTSDVGSMIPYHRALLGRGYRALIFSGDHDMCVPFTGSEAWTRGMGYSIVGRWHPWFSDNQVAGYTISYSNNLTFATIKGAGHTVPEYKPEEAFTFFNKWLAGEPL